MKALKLVLRLNAASCLVFGLLFGFLPANVGNFIGTDQHFVIFILGIGLALNGLYLLFSSTRKNAIALEIYNFSFGDILWFCGTIICIAGGFFITTWAGILLGIIIAIMVLSLGLAQLWFYAELHNLGTNGEYMLPANLPRFAAIKTSWLGMKTWVKNWLFSLNVVFLTAIFFLPFDFAQYVLAGFVICGPLLFALMIVQRGLTRLLGIAHLIPWVPLLAYIVAYLINDIQFATSPYIFSYLLTFIIFTSICLSLDIVDVYRWLKGDKFRLGVEKPVK